MTDDERRNRNPDVEVCRITQAEIDAFPLIDDWHKLRVHQVYVLISAHVVATFNYRGMSLGLDAATLLFCEACHFRGPRANLDVFLRPMPDGTLQDGVTGETIVVREYQGPDA